MAKADQAAPAHERRRPSPAPPERATPRPPGTPPPASADSPASRFRPPGGMAFWWVLIALFAVNFFVVSLLPDQGSRVTVPYTTFRAEVAASNVSDVTSKGDVIQGDFKKPVTYPPKGGKTSAKFDTTRPAFADDGLLQLLIDKQVTVNAKPVDEGRSLFATLLLSFGPTVLLVVLFVFLMRRATAGAGGGVLGNFGRSKAKRYVETGQRITFDDVAGIDEAEEELVEIVDFLRTPDKYPRLGGDDPARRAAVRPARHRQDPARARGGRRGRRAVLLATRPRSSSR